MLLTECKLQSLKCFSQKCNRNLITGQQTQHLFSPSVDLAEDISAGLNRLCQCSPLMSSEI